MIDEQKVRDAYCELAPKLTNYLVANGLEYPSACDIVQETFLQLWKNRKIFSEKDSISGFVFTVARNLRTDYYRHGKFMVYQEQISDEAAGMSDFAKNRNTDLVYLRKRLQREIALLPEEMRSAYTLSQIAKLSISEIAELTGVSESLVKVRIHRARKKLKVQLMDLKKNEDF